MEKLLKKKKTALILAVLSIVIGVASLVVIIISTVNFLYIPLIISILAFTFSAYAIPLFLISVWDFSRMTCLIEIMRDMSEEERLDTLKVRVLGGLKNQKYADRLIEKIKKGGYLA